MQGCECCDWYTTYIEEDKRRSECHTCGHIPHEKEAAVVWTCEKERRARELATSAQHDSEKGKDEMKTTAKIDEHHQEGHGSGMKVNYVQDRG